MRERQDATGATLNSHDREEKVARAAQEDGALLQTSGYDLQWLRREPAMYGVVARKDGETTKLEWAVDADYRFFPDNAGRCIRLCAPSG